MLGGGVAEEVLTPSAGELDLEAKEKGSSPAEPNTLLPKANLLMSFPEEDEEGGRKRTLGNDAGHSLKVQSVIF
jgi:hypothetical protein